MNLLNLAIYLTSSRLTPDNCQSLFGRFPKKEASEKPRKQLTCLGR